MKQKIADLPPIHCLTALLRSLKMHTLIKKKARAFLHLQGK